MWYFFLNVFQHDIYHFVNQNQKNLCFNKPAGFIHKKTIATKKPKFYIQKRLYTYLTFKKLVRTPAKIKMMFCIIGDRQQLQYQIVRVCPKLNDSFKKYWHTYQTH